MSVLFRHAKELGWVKENPALDVIRLAIPENKQRPHEPWTDEACAIFRERAHLEALLAFELGIETVQRPGDLVNIKWGDYNGETIHVKQSKTGKSLVLPCSPRLKRILEAEKVAIGGDPHPSLHILRGTGGKKLTYSGLAQMMKKERERLKLLKYDLHAMRYRGVMELAWAGCTDEEIMSYSGHDSIEMVRKYAGIARQEMRAKSANKKRSRKTKT
jgi:integrase